MGLQLKLIPDEIIAQYNLREKADNKGWVYVCIELGMYGLPQAGLLANKLLAKRLNHFGYYHCQYTPGLWRHAWHPITFSLVVDDFGIKTVGLTHAKHLKQALEQHYEVDVDWKGQLYCGVHLNWDYKHKTVNLSMPDYISKALTRFQHSPPLIPQNSPYNVASIQYGQKIQLERDPDTSSILSPDRIKYIQQVVGTLLYYSHASTLPLLPPSAPSHLNRPRERKLYWAHTNNSSITLPRTPMHPSSIVQAISCLP